jgi:preprotein translocase subunit SecA
MERPEVAPSGRGPYPEREDRTAPALDRFVATLGFRFRNAFRREARDVAGFAAEVGHYAERFAEAGLLQHLAGLRYRLRRDGPRRGLLAQCLGACCAAWRSDASPAPLDPDALAAAVVMLQGGLAEVADPAARRRAVAFAALVRAIEGVPVHVFAATGAGAKRFAEMLRAPLAAMGMEPGLVAQGMDARARRAAHSAPVVCGTQRDVAVDYLRDRLRLGGRPRPLAGVVERVAGQGTDDPLMLRGLHCALVDDADAVLLDDAHLPLAISVEAEQSAERLLYEQALEFARALAPGADYEVREGETRLTAEGARRAGRLVAPLGGIWAARRRREDLIVLALDALHRCRRGEDYEVEQGRVVRPGAERAPEEDVSDEEQILQHLIEVKEGCRFSGRRDTLVRISVPRFFRRYLRLSGAAPDARGLERELWSMYSLATTRVGAPPAAVGCRPRVFRGTADKMEALVAAVNGCVSGGASALIALRTSAEAQAAAAALRDGGLQPRTVSGGGEPAEREILDGLDWGRQVVLLLYPAERWIADAGRRRLRLFAGELHDARRHVERLARKFGLDSFESLFSLEDDVVVKQLAPALRRAARLAAGNGGELPPAWAHRLHRLAQDSVERACEAFRADVLARDQYLDELLAFSGKVE